MHSKVSVVVPVYNVEAYLRTCVESILAQTYEELDVILVDDGSTDSSSAICDEYARLDDRVRVIHKANGGLSDARNAGLDAVTSPYVGFVDSDDWIEPEMYERLLELLLGNGSDIAACNFSYSSPSGDDDAWGVPFEVTLPQRPAMRLLLRDQIVQNYVWNKLYSARLWDGVRFPRGKAFEDVSTTWRVFERAGSVSLSPWVGYRYRTRDDSIVHLPNIKQQLDCAIAFLERYETLAGRYPECADKMAAGVVYATETVWKLAWQNRRLVTGDLAPQMRRLADFASRHLDDALLVENAAKRGFTGRERLKMLPKASLPAYLMTSLLERAYRAMHPASEDDKRAEAAEASLTAAGQAPNKR
ncbi:MAG: glycosyltransferase [Coriobacteriales bacterium]